ncbi:hypothetical protein R1sor_015591 [Riccia sorocarpa]|uniref:Reverse transcriptase zinc-binding domain-containing protein n=1 Tax=Riccia sorocarpa TaxID=122646 RepID=A0ABD3HCP0_9MARC
MSLLRRSEREGRISGLWISPGKTLLHQLFADDTGVCIQAREGDFQELERILARYEVASGAKVNMEKSLVMPMGLADCPAWLRQKGCGIIEGEQSFKYLGVRVGRNISDSVAVDEAVQRIKNRLNQWENHYLSWKPLIAWKRLIRPKPQGGLGFAAFEQRSKALQMRYATAILDEGNQEWIWMCKRMMQIKLMTGPYKKEREKWDGGTAMLLLKSWRFSEAKTLDRICRVWFAMKGKLRLNDIKELPASLPVASLKAVWQMMGHDVGHGFRELEASSRARKLQVLDEFRLADSKLDMEKLLSPARVGFPSVRIDPRISQWLSSVLVSDRHISKAEGWAWIGGSTVQNGWKQETSSWMQLQRKLKPIHKKLSRWWEIPADPTEWSRRWKLLWQGSSLNRTKLWVWKILHFGLITLAKTEQWGVTDGTCLLCQRDNETLDHLLWSCSRLRERRDWITMSLKTDGTGPLTLLQAFDIALGNHRKNLGQLILLAEYCHTCWIERNKMVYDQVRGYLPSKNILESARLKALAAWRRTPGERGGRLQQQDEAFFVLADSTLALQNACARNTARILREIGLEREDSPLVGDNSSETVPRLTVENTSSESEDEDSSGNDSG